MCLSSVLLGLLLCSVQGFTFRGQGRGGDRVLFNTSPSKTRLAGSHGLLTSPDDALKSCLPLLFGDWTLQEERMDKPLWGKKAVRADFQVNAGIHSYGLTLMPKGKLDHGLDSHLKGLNWSLNFKDIYATGKLEFRIVHPPPEFKLTANDQLPTIHYYCGSFKEGLDCVEGWIERYADINDEKLGPIRRRVRVGYFQLLKNKHQAEAAPVPI